MDSTGAPVKWITEATLTGNVCSFKIDTSTVIASSIIYVTVATVTPITTSIESKPITIEIKDTTPPPPPPPPPAVEDVCPKPESYTETKA